MISNHDKELPRYLDAKVTVETLKRKVLKLQSREERKNPQNEIRIASYLVTNSEALCAEVGRVSSREIPLYDLKSSDVIDIEKWVTECFIQVLTLARSYGIDISSSIISRTDPDLTKENTPSDELTKIRKFTHTRVKDVAHSCADRQPYRRRELKSKKVS